ncbi:hypothetical protein [Cellulosilyticum sp. I15G10I2]|uniref:hypothetical protein n=1 Tax=Cellulosilyticum sp. I15G10I2 TaxID=1892843 RepID=UPI00085C3CC2|nr:hypothetical protein [Cellulosilyticum sp. I15G10I2]
MKKEYIHCIIGLIILFLGATSCITAIILNDLLASSKSVLFLFGVCFILVGIVSYAQHNKKYLKIKYLKNNEIPVIAHWVFKPNSSSYINELLYERKSSTVSTIILTFILCLVIACCILFSGEKYSLSLSIGLIVVSFLALPTALFYNDYSYNSKLTSSSEALIGEDCIYFLDELYTLHKSIYFLEDIRINYSSENTLQFLYGDYDLYTGPMYTINIPIPLDELEVAQQVQKHYLDLILYE